MARKTKAEAEATRCSLLDAAERLFHERGVAHTSLHDIAQAAGVTRGAVYWHFADKVALFHALMERVQFPIEDAAEGDGGDGDRAVAIARLRRLLVGTLERVVDDAQVRRVFEIALHKVEYVDGMAVVRRRHVQAIRDYRAMVARCLHAAGVDAVAADTHAHGLHALVAGLIQTWMLAPDEFDLVAVGGDAIATHLRGLLAPAG